VSARLCDPPRAAGGAAGAATGVESAVGKAGAAGDGNVGVSGPNIAQQCLNLGLLDEPRIDLVPALLGEGVTHLRYR
jgi:dihydrofolate reductase